MRVTSKMMFNQADGSMMTANEGVFGAQTRLESGKKILTPSDDPAAVTKILNYRTIETNIDQYSRNINAVRARLESTESALGSASNAIQRLKELAIAQANATNTAADRKIGAAEARQLFEELVGIGNTKTENGYIFGGYASSAAPFQTTTPFTTGTTISGEINVQIDSGMTIKANIRGDMAFGAAGGIDVLDAVNRFVNALNANNLADSTTVGFAAQPAAGNAFTLQGKTYEFNSGGPLVNPGAIPITIGAALTNTIDNATTAVLANATNITAVNSGGMALALTSTSFGSNTVVANVGTVANQTVSNNSSVQTTIGEMDAALNQIVNARADVGARLGRVDAVKERLDGVKLATGKARSNEEDIDLAKAITDFTAKQQALEAARSSAAKMFEMPTLMDFLS